MVCLAGGKQRPTRTFTSVAHTLARLHEEGARVVKPERPVISPPPATHIIETIDLHTIQVLTHMATGVEAPEPHYEQVDGVTTCRCYVSGVVVDRMCNALFFDRLAFTVYKIRTDDTLERVDGYESSPSIPSNILPFTKG